MDEEVINEEVINEENDPYIIIRIFILTTPPS